MEPGPKLLSEAGCAILEEHASDPLDEREQARIWSHAALKGVELFQGSYRNYEFAPHFHSVPALGVVDRGTMRCDYGSVTHYVPAGGIIMLNPGDVHAPGTVGEDGWSFRVFFLDNELFRDQSTTVTGQVLRFAEPFLEDSRLAKTLLQLHLQMEGQISTLEAESSLLSVFEQLAERQGASAAESQPPRAEKQLVRTIRDYIHSCYRRNVSLADLSSAVKMSPFHLLRTFRREVGLTPHAYLIQVRVEAAKRLLRSRIPIVHVASYAGFADQSHLTRHFKRLTGVTPSRYLA